MAMGFPIVGPPGVPFNDRKPVPVPPPPPPPSSASSFPILAITVLGIVTTAILLLTYYVFVIKCCLNWHRSDVIGRLPRSRRRHGRHEDASASYSTYLQGRGLEESAIQAIPTFRFRSAGGGEEGGRSPSSFHECAVCLNEFQEEERVRLLPSCLHVFHIDCIDVWLQTHANCPLCRSEITARAIPTGLAAAQSPRPNNSDGGGGSGSVVIEVRDEANVGGGDEVATTPGARRKKERKLRKVPSMGDEFVDGARRKEEQVPVMRRSFSMDSSGDRQLYLAVQEILRQNPHFREIGGDGEGSSSRVRRPFFSFGRSRSRSRSRSSQNSLLPLQNPDD